MIKIGIVGFGHLGKYLYESILKDEKLLKLFQIQFIWNRTIENIKDIDTKLILKDLKDFKEYELDLIVEVAHPNITKDYGIEFLKYTNFFCGSPTALADEKLEKELRKVADDFNHGFYIPSGALWAAQDIEKMSKLGDLKELTITMKKHPLSLKVEKELDLKLKEYIQSNSKEEFILYKGNVKQLCPLAPNNVNTMACAALAAFHLGFEKVNAILIADKSLEAHIIEIEVIGKNGFYVKTTRYNPAKVGAVTGNATYASFLSSLSQSFGRGKGFHFC